MADAAAGSADNNAEAPSGKRRHSTYAHVFAVTGIILLFVVLRWNSYDAPLTRDEGEYAYAAQLLRHGMVPYESSFLQKPPMVVYCYWLAQLVAPNVFWFPRLLAYACAAGATALVGIIARKEFDRSVALAAMGLMTPMILLPHLDQFIANTEMFMLLPVVALAFTFCAARNRPDRTQLWFVAGLLAGAALLFKYTITPFILFIFSIWTFELVRARTAGLRLLRCWGAAVAGTLVAGFSILLLFILAGATQRLWECTVVYNRLYVASTFSWAHTWDRFGAFWRAWPALFVLTALAILVSRGRALVWIGMLLATFLTAAGAGYGHYYIIMMPLWALVTAAGLRKLALNRRLNFRFTKSSYSVVIIVCILTIALADWPWIRLSKQEFAVKKMASRSVWLEARNVADKIAALTSAGDYVYVAGSEPEILYYAQRFSPTRFVIAYPLTLPTLLARQYQKEAIDALEAHPPGMMVMVQSSTSWLVQPDTPPDYLEYLNKLAAEKYDVVGGYIDRGEAVGWHAPIEPTVTGRASLLLFKRRQPSPPSL